MDILIRLGGCPGSPESSLAVQVMLSVLCDGSFGIAKPFHIQFYVCLATTELLHIDGYFFATQGLICSNVFFKIC